MDDIAWVVNTRVASSLRVLIIKTTQKSIMTSTLLRLAADGSERELLEGGLVEELLLVHARQHLPVGVVLEHALHHQGRDVGAVDGAADVDILGEDAGAGGGLGLEPARSDDAELHAVRRRQLLELILGLHLLEEHGLEGLVNLRRRRALAVAGADGGDEHKLGHSALLLALGDGGLDEVDVALGVRLGVRGGSADGGHDGVVLLNHVVSLLDGGLVERVSLGEEGAHLLDLRPVVLLALEHGHPRPRVLELANDVHGDARSSRDEDADVVWVEVGARGLGADGGARDGLGGAELLGSGAGLEGEGPGGGGGHADGESGHDVCL
mmetsp:Transcript_7732/g.30550  ORF Transcript_7732/g.30550 Transcript_7732/m.30550 type:complete len:324 (-) Transcript_7732:60-1031(-)